MTHQLKALATLASLVLVPVLRTLAPTWHLTTVYNSSSKDPVHTSDLHGHCTTGALTHIQAKHSYT